MAIEILRGTAVVRRPQPPDFHGCEEAVSDGALGEWRIEDAELGLTVSDLRVVRNTFRSGATVDIAFTYERTPYRGSAFVMSIPRGEFMTKPFSFTGTGKPEKTR